MPKEVLLFSGGMDSFAAWRLLGEPLPVYFALGHRYQWRELEAITELEHLCAKRGLALEVKVIANRLELGDLEQANAFIPLRNFLLAAGGVLEGASRVYLGGLRGETSRDKSQRFFRDASRLFSFLENRPVDVQAPFRHMTKTQLVRAYRQRFPNDIDLLLATRSCYSDGDIGCGRCMACFRRWVAMTNNGIHEDYAEEPYTWSEVQGHDWSKWWAILRRTPVAEWGGVIINNLDAYKALRGQSYA